MNNNISISYNTKAKKQISVSDVFVNVLSWLLLGAEYTAYVIAYAMNVVYQNASVLLHSRVLAAVAKFAYSCIIACVAVAFFGVIGGMEAGTIDIGAGCIACGVMCLGAVLAINRRK